MTLATACGAEGDGDTTSTGVLRRPEGIGVLDELPPAPRPGANATPPRYAAPGALSMEELMSLVGLDASAFWRSSFTAAGYEWTDAQQVVVGPAGAASKCNRAARPVDPPLFCEHDSPPTILLPVEWISQRAAPLGDFAYAVIVAHEWGHQVQNVTGLLEERRRFPNRLFEGHLELQADCLAGVWAFAAHEEGALDPGDINEALALLARIADLPRTKLDEPGAHGTPAERKRWFRRGYESGRPSRCKPWTGSPPNAIRLPRRAQAPRDASR